jgi:FtsH-binding integral membrane protein
MPPGFRPPGRTLKERWPQEAEERRYFAATTYAVVVGGLLGLLTVPFWISALLSGAPWLVVVLLAALIAIAVTISRANAASARWLALAWKVGAWVVGAAALGLVLEAIGLAICNETCRGSLAAARGTVPLLLIYAVLVAGSAGIAILADQWGNALRRRAPRPATPR